MNPQTAQEKILEAILGIIAEEGLQSVTTRKIAARADVNIAAINYYFGSKDKAINAVAESLMSNLKSAFALLDDESVSAMERLRTFITTYGKMQVQYPDLVRFFIFQSITSNNASDYQQFLITNGQNSLQKSIMEASGCGMDCARMKGMALLGAIIFPGLISSVTKKMFQVDMHDETQLKDYFEVLLQGVCAPV